MRLTIILIFSLILIAFVRSKDDEVIYRSTSQSYLENFYLIIKDSSIILFGWEPAYGDRDTLYYKSKSKLESYKRNKYDNDRTIYSEDYYLRFELKEYEISYLPYDLNNLEAFKGDSSLSYQFNFLFYPSFTQGKQFGDSIKIHGIKHNYDGRGDEFVFKRIMKN